MITLIPIEEVYNNIDDYNTNNFNEGMSCEEYNKQMQQTGLSKYIDDLYDPSEYSVCRLGKEDVDVLLEAGKSGVITLKPPSAFKEELEEISTRIQRDLNIGLGQGLKAFVRLERCSLKDSCIGAGPYMSSLDIVHGLCTSFRGYNYMKKILESEGVLDIYIFPWKDNIKMEHEFRVFVHCGRITAISQYNIYNDYGLSALDLEGIAMKISELPRSTAKLPPSYTMDVYLDEHMNPHIIEYNSFGKEMAAGSCLFHWIKDHDQLYGLNEGIEIRVVGGCRKVG